jgi:hypothetical protein
MDYLEKEHHQSQSQTSQGVARYRQAPDGQFSQRSFDAKHVKWSDQPATIAAPESSKAVADDDSDTESLEW